jgi:cation diffusion facilitator family transporter
MAVKPDFPQTQQTLARMAFLAIAAAIATMALKVGAYLVTDSVGLLSDAVESSANLISAMIALFAVWYASRPIDRTHNYGHQKVEFFAGAMEGIFILIAAGGIAFVAIQRLRDPQEIEGFGAGVAISIAAAAINLVVARLLMRAGRAHGSVAIDADGRHLMTDVVTSIGVVIGLTLAHVTGIEELDPIIALLIAVNIVWTAISLIRSGVDGLMDRALPDADVELVREAIARQMGNDETFHALRTRRAGSRQFVDFHLLVPGELTVQRAHKLTERIESAVSDVLPNAQTTVHIEPIEDPVAYDAEEIAPFEDEEGPQAPNVHAGHRPIAHAR